MYMASHRMHQTCNTPSGLQSTYTFGGKDILNHHIRMNGSAPAIHPGMARRSLILAAIAVRMEFEGMFGEIDSDTHRLRLQAHPRDAIQPKTRTRAAVRVTNSRALRTHDPRYQKSRILDLR
jgi:hypothetical protein